MCILTSTITRGNIQPVKSRKMHYRNYPRLHNQSENRQTSRDIGQWPSLQVNKRLDIDKVFTHEFICQSFDQQSEMEAVTKLTAKP